MLVFLQEILTVSPQTTPLLPQEPPFSLSSATEPSLSSSSELVSAIVIGATCFVAMATAVVFVCKSRFLRRRPTNNLNPVEFSLMQGNGSIHHGWNIDHRIEVFRICFFKILIQCLCLTAKYKSIHYHIALHFEDPPPSLTWV